MKIPPFILIVACLYQPLVAGSSEDRAEEIKRMRTKESTRAKETADLAEDREGFEKRYGWIKETSPTLFSAAMEKQLMAAKAWRKASEELANADGYDQVNAIKLPAYEAEAAAEIARLELKAAGAEREWKRNAEKSGSREVSAIAEQMIQNQKNIIQTTRQHQASQRMLRQLEIERMQLDKKMREAQDQARKPQEKREEKDKRDEGHDHNRKPAPGKDREPHDTRPGKVLVE